jgi:hypothetical protein
MKKTLKIAGISLAVLALVSNLYTAIFTFYGIKTHNLAGQVWAQSTSTSTNGTGSSSSGLFWSEQTGGCYVSQVTLIPVTTYASGGGTASVTFSGNQVNGVNLGGTGTSSSNNQYVAIFTAGSQVTCNSGWWTCSAKACSYPPGTKASYVILNGQQISAH